MCETFEAGSSGKNDSIKPFLLNTNVMFKSWSNGDRRLKRRDVRWQKEKNRVDKFTQFLFFNSFMKKMSLYYKAIIIKQ